MSLLSAVSTGGQQLPVSQYRWGPSLRTPPCCLYLLYSVPPACVNSIPQHCSSGHRRRTAACPLLSGPRSRLVTVALAERLQLGLQLGFALSPTASPQASPVAGRPKFSFAASQFAKPPHSEVHPDQHSGPHAAPAREGATRHNVVLSCGSG